MLEAIRDDPRMGEDIMENADYLRVELHLAATTEMITRLEDFMRRRSKIELVVREGVIRDSSGLDEVAQILFGDDAERRLREYRDSRPPSAPT
jgi:glycerol-3-phosphate dehydrogenase